MAKLKEFKEKEKMNPFLWFLFAIVIPVIIAITLTVIVFAVAGVDVVNWAKNTGEKIPVLSSIITTEEEARELEKKESNQAKLDKKEAEIEKLSEEKQTLENTVEQLEQQIVKLERDLEVAKQQPDAEVEVEDTNKTVKQLSSSFTEMKGEQAALIIEQLDTSTAFLILNEMSNKDRGAIMEKMTPEAAAEIAKRFINQ